ncbi:YdeI/OmpD-associated family protein [Larkinella soli]|uniref:YdeI/OmpD-associated family protein n=1 Tax=Larkinella soli TaxID=1770527 RepID=UPI0013E3E851|nr:DUF1905 domain-containing protein [Larkinella soli]
MESKPWVRFESTVDRFPYKGGVHFLDVPDPVARRFTGKGPARVVCRINGTVEFSCALMPKGAGQYFIHLGKKLRDKAGLTYGGSLTAEIRTDDSPYGMPMPEELQELLAIDEEGNRRFHELTPGRRRSIMYWIASAGNVQTRVDRAIEQIDKLKRAKSSS